MGPCCPGWGVADVPHFKMTPRGLVPYDPGLPASAQPTRIPPFRSTARWQRLAKRQIRRLPRRAECGHEGSPENPLTAEHITALAAGGDPCGPLQTVCKRCNSSKGAM